MEVAQEEASTPVVAKAVAVEVETEAPAVQAVPPAPAQVAAEVNENAANSPLKEVVAAVETEAQSVATKAKRVLKNVAAKVGTEVKAVEERTRVVITAEEHNIALKMENEFLRLSQQISVFQKQAESIQKQYPEYVKSLASKYVVDLTKNTFQAIEGAFTKNQ